MSNNILKKINNIDFGDLCLIEKDLSFSEKVSLAFLLFADQKPNAEYILQKLLVISSNTNADTDILISYTKVNKNWKPFLVEGLAIIKSKKVLRKLYLTCSDIRTNITKTRSYINPILRALYSLCEMITPIQAGNLVLDVRDAISTGSSNDHLRFYDFDYLEVFLLDWITRQVLDASGGKSTDINVLIDYCKRKKMIDIIYMLDYSLIDLNLTTDRQITEPLNEEICFVENVSILNTIKQFSKVPVSRTNCYEINKKRAGYVLIINQKEFHESANPEIKNLLPIKPLKERTGTDVDKISLRNTFSSFGYIPVTRDNLNHIDVLSNIREVVKRSDMYDSLIVCILSHGIEGSVYGCDSIPIKIDDIEKILTAQSLLRKPKILIIQACQGGVLQQARQVENLEQDTSDNSSADFADMVKAMSTVPGFASLRDIKKGSWFIQTLCTKIDELGDSDHILEILTEVNAEVGDKRGFDNICMTPISSQTLRKKLYLPCRLP